MIKFIMLNFVLILLFFSCNKSKYDVKKAEVYNSNRELIELKKVLKKSTTLYFLPKESCEKCAAEILTYYSHLPDANLIMVFNKSISEPPKNEISNEYVLVGKYVQPVIGYYNVRKRPYFIQIDKDFNVINEGASLMDLL